MNASLREIFCYGYCAYFALHLHRASNLSYAIYSIDNKFMHVAIKHGEALIDYAGEHTLRDLEENYGPGGVWTYCETTNDFVTNIARMNVHLSAYPRQFSLAYETLVRERERFSDLCQLNIPALTYTV